MLYTKGTTFRGRKFFERKLDRKGIRRIGKCTDGVFFPMRILLGNIPTPLVSYWPKNLFENLFNFLLQRKLFAKILRTEKQNWNFWETKILRQEAVVILLDLLKTCNFEDALCFFGFRLHYFLWSYCSSLMFQDLNPAILFGNKHCFPFPSLKSLSQHLEDQDVEAFTAEVKAFDQISRLDQWYTTILLRIKKQIPDGDELC